MALFGAGSAFLSVAPSAAVGDVVHGRGGTVIAAFQMSADLGAVIGPLVAGWLADEYSFGAAFGVTAGVLVAGLGAAAAVQGDAAPGRGRGTGTGSRHHRLRQATQTAARVKIRCVTPLGERVASIS